MMPFGFQIHFSLLCGSFKIQMKSGCAINEQSMTKYVLIVYL